MNQQNKILGALLGAAAGEAMGNATKSMPIEFLYQYYNGWIDSFLPIPDLYFDVEYPAGHVSEGFSVSYYIIKTILKNGGLIDDKTCDRALLDWLDDGRFSSMMTPCLYQRISALTGGNYQQYPNMVIVPHQATIGGAKHAFPAGLFAGGDYEKAVKWAVTITRNTHENSASLSASCALAAAVCEAMKPVTDPLQIIKASIKGAKYGFEAGKSFGKEFPVPRVDNYIQLAFGLAEKPLDDVAFMYALRDRIGCFREAYQALPTALGIFVHTRADACAGIRMAANMGGESDTIAAFVGLLSGALHGADAFPDEYQTLVERVNNFDLTELSQSIISCVESSI